MFGISCEAKVGILIVFYLLCNNQSSYCRLSFKLNLELAISSSKGFLLQPARDDIINFLGLLPQRPMRGIDLLQG